MLFSPKELFGESPTLILSLYRPTYLGNKKYCKEEKYPFEGDRLRFKTCFNFDTPLPIHHCTFFAISNLFV